MKYTKNLKLFQYETEEDGKEVFDINKALNENFDKLDEAIGGGGLEVGDIGQTLYVDESKGLRRYLNGSLLTKSENTKAFETLLENVAALYPSLVCTEDEWQTIKQNSDLGQCGKFVISEETIRLPRIIMPLQGLCDLTKLGEMVEAGLPNIKGEFWPSDGTDSISHGCVYDSKSNGYAEGSGQSNKSYGNHGYFIDASRSSKVYGKSSTVQQEQIQYPYFIQIATGIGEKAHIINTLEQNHPYTLLEPKYSEVKLYNPSMLLSNGSFYSGAGYVTVWEALQVEQNNSVEIGTTVTLPSGTQYIKKGWSVKLSTETFDDYDFVINTNDVTFRLPIKSKLASGKAVIGNGTSLGLTDGNRNSTLYTGCDSYDGFFMSTVQSGYGLPVGSTRPTSGGLNLSDLLTVGVTTDSDKSGIETSDKDLYLYYYVGDTFQNPSLVDVPRVIEQLSEKTDKSEAAHSAMPSDRYINLTLGSSGTAYTAPADGWIHLQLYKASGFTGGVSSSIDIQNNEKLCSYANGYTSNYMRHIVPIRKGDSFRAYYSDIGESSGRKFMFIYAEGSY